MPASRVLKGLDDKHHLLYKTKPDMNRDIQFTAEDHKIDDHNRQEAPLIASFRKRIRPNSKFVACTASQKSLKRNQAEMSSANILFNNEDNKRLSTEEQVHSAQTSFYFNLKHLPPKHQPKYFINKRTST